MKVLFVSSGNYGLSPIIKAQAASLEHAGIDVKIYPLIGKGLPGYLRAIIPLKKAIITTNPDIVHAHYSLCGIVAYLASSRPVIVSLMGSDVKQSGLFRVIIRIFVKYLWQKTIVKSADMKDSLGLVNVTVLPNGVDTEVFIPLDKAQCRSQLNWDAAGSHVLFVAASNPDRFEKNLPLAQEAIKLCNNKKNSLHVVSNITQSKMPAYLNASDLLLLTSRWEGSPNIVKEAMACNVPVVSTNVGDVKWLFGTTDGYFLSRPTPEDVAVNIEKALTFKGRTQGRERILALKLDSQSVANVLISTYKDIAG